MTKNMIKTLEQQEIEIAEAGDMHDKDCCVHFPEDGRACDVGTGTLDCCENMKWIKYHLDQYATTVLQECLGEEIENITVDINSSSFELSKHKQIHISGRNHHRQTAITKAKELFGINLK